MNKHHLIAIIVLVALMANFKSAAQAQIAYVIDSAKFEVAGVPGDSISTKIYLKKNPGITPDSFFISLERPLGPIAFGAPGTTGSASNISGATYITGMQNIPVDTGLLQVYGLRGRCFTATPPCFLKVKVSVPIVSTAGNQDSIRYAWVSGVKQAGELLRSPAEVSNAVLCSGTFTTYQGLTFSFFKTPHSFITNVPVELNFNNFNTKVNSVFATTPLLNGGIYYTKNMNDYFRFKVVVSTCCPQPCGP